MALILKFSVRPRQAFASGFMKGLGAPYMLFGNFEAGTLPTIPVVTPQVLDPYHAILKDWTMVGQDINTASQKYGETAVRNK